MQARVNDAVINFEIEGPESSPVVTLSHSLAATLDMWEFQVSALRDSYRVLRFDMRGHGKSSIPLGPYSMEKLVADVVGLLDYLDIQSDLLCRPFPWRNDWTGPGSSISAAAGKARSVRYRLQHAVRDASSLERAHPEG